MKYAIDFYRGAGSLLEKADEILLNYNEKTTNIISYVQDTYRENQRIILKTFELEEKVEDVIGIFKAVKQIHPNFAVIARDKYEFDVYKENDIDSFFYDFVKDLDTLDAMINMGVSDIYIFGNLGFSIEQVANICHKNNIKVRVIPNVTVNGTVKDFFIRPEDVDIYEPYVDVMQFYGLIDRQHVLYDIYNNKEWNDLLYLIIPSIEDHDIINNTILPGFGKIRLNCHKKCVFDECNFCDRIKNISDKFKNAHIGIEKVNKNESKTT